MTTRRQVLAAAIAAPIVIAPAAAAAPMFACATLETSPQWRTAVANQRSAQAAYDAYYAQVFEPAHNLRKQKRHDEEWELQRQIDAIPHHTTTATFDSMSGPRSMTTHSAVDVRMALGSVARPYDDADLQTCCEELFRAIGKRISAESEIRNNFSFSADDAMPAAISGEHDRLESLSYQAYREVTDFEASTPGDLIAKITFLQSIDCELEHEEVLADLARIFGGRSS